MTPVYSYQRQGRSRRTGVTVLLVWFALLFALFYLEAAPGIVGFLALFTLPACWDLVRNPPSGFGLTSNEMSWHSGKRHAQVALTEIDHVRLDTRLDFSVRATVVLSNGTKIRLPFEATPPDQELERQLNALDITTKRFHFQLFQ